MSPFLRLLTISLLLSISLHSFSSSSSSSSSSSTFPFNVSYHIDCGGSATTTDRYGTTWISDRYFTGGSSSVVSEPLRFQLSQEKTLRFFPPTTSGKKNCYIIPTTNSSTSTSTSTSRLRRFFFRTFTVYDNYDGKSHPPSFQVSVQGTVVFSYTSPWPDSLSRAGSYSDVFAFLPNSDPASLCFYTIATDPPLISSIEAVEVDPASYSSDSSSLAGHLLVNYGRISCADNQWGPGFSNDTDLFGRSWQSGYYFRSKHSKSVDGISTTRTVRNAALAPNYFPEKLYRSAMTLRSNDGVLQYDLPVDAKLDYLLYFHFAEIDYRVNRPGQRVFDVLINGVHVTRIDIFKSAGGAFAAYDWHYVAKNLTNDTLALRFLPVVGLPLICGIESYAVVPADLATLPDQVQAMTSLKDSLRVPDRMGWNGDPCGPTSWDAWEGLTCRTNKDGNALIVSQIDLSSQGLKGFISDDVGLLKNLVSLNLSLNSLEGSLPVGLGELPLAILDLSNNELTGSIPDTLTSKTLRTVLLNDNQLEGAVPEELYSIGVHGGVIDLSGNKGLCGVPPLPDCPMFWHNDRLSESGKIAIAISSVVFFCVVLLVVYICIQKRRNEYNFGLPNGLMSLSAKRNKYHRQKSLMALEMEKPTCQRLDSQSGFSSIAEFYYW